MPRRMLTDAEKNAISRRMKARWAKINASPPTNGLVVVSKIVLYVHDQEIALNVEEARQLRELLTASLPPLEPTS